MNAYFGVLNLTETPINASDLVDCIFTTQHWTPDHQCIHVDGPFGYTVTQRFMRPECHRSPHPFIDKKGTVFLGDLSLTNRISLLKKLDCSAECADIELVSLAYQKWGTGAFTHLNGAFSLVIWDTTTQTLYLAVDRFTRRHCYVSVIPGKYVLFSNTMTHFHQFLSDYSLNETSFSCFSLDMFPPTQTSINEVFRIDQASYIAVKNDNVYQHRYFDLTEWRQKKTRKSRDEWYALFKEEFKLSVSDALRSVCPVSAHLSGGLDSSAVASVAADLLKTTPLNTYTAIPNALDGESYRKNWHFNEAAIVDDVVAMYPNIRHNNWKTNLKKDPLKDYRQMYPHMDQPLRNVFNYQWITGILEEINISGGRVVLNGQGGNYSVSWHGMRVRSRIKICLIAIKDALFPMTAYSGFYDYLRKGFVDSWFVRKCMIKKIFVRDHHLKGMVSANTRGMKASLRTVELFYGVDQNDPTTDDRMIKFCMRLPQWIYFTDFQNPLKRRLLIRDALRDYLPESRIKNATRGLQAPDWYFTYNLHRNEWKKKVLDLPTTHYLWQYYDRDRILSFFETHKEINQLSKSAEFDVRYRLVRFIAVMDFSEFLAARKGS